MSTEFELLHNAYLLTTLTSVTFGVVGSFVVARRIGYLTGAIAHSAFGGVGVGLWLSQTVGAGALGFGALSRLLSGSAAGGSALCARLAACIRPVPCALVFAALSALLVDFIRRRANEREETLLGALWALGVGVGLICIEKVDGYASVNAYLFGDVLLVSRADVWFSAVLSVVILSLTIWNFKRLEAVCFDEEFAELRGVNVARQNRLLLLLTSVTVVLLMRVTGMALIVSLLTLPAATACRFTKRLGSTIVASIVLCLFGSLLGIKLSYELNISTGPTITLVVALFYLIALLVHPLRRLMTRAGVMSEKD